MILIVKPTRCTSFSNYVFLHNTLHVSDGLSVHHQELKIVHTVTGICQTDTATCLLAFPPLMLKRTEKLVDRHIRDEILGLHPIHR
jgi:hypothetical protein